MAKRKSKTQKKVEKEVKKQAKKHPVAVLLVLVTVLTIAAVGGFLLYKYGEILSLIYSLLECTCHNYTLSKLYMLE